MDNFTELLGEVAAGKSLASEQLLPLVYDELRRLAAARMAGEKPGQTLQATALVHEAFLRLVGTAAPDWNSRGHFFGAAAEAMRRILVDAARRRGAQRRGGDWQRVSLHEGDAVAEQSMDLLALHEALSQLETEDTLAANLVKLRYFAGLTMSDAAKSLNIPLRTAERNWTFAKSWLHARLAED